MTENSGILQVPISGKTSDSLNKDTSKLVYVHIPKDKDSSLPTSFTLTKSAKLSGGSNITFSSRAPLNSVASKPRPPILGNKLTLSPAITSSSMNTNTKSIKVSLSGNHSFGTSSSPSIFRTTTAINSSNVIVTQGMMAHCNTKRLKIRNLGSSSSPQNLSGNTITLLGSGAQSASPVICSSAPQQVRGPSLLSQIPPKQSKSVFLQSRILTGSKTTPKVVSQKLLPVALPVKAPSAASNKTLVSYGTILQAGVVNSPSPSPGGVKRDCFGTPKREGANYTSFTPPPLILQSAGNAKKLGSKKSGGGPTTISIVTGKSSSGSGSGISVFPIARTGNLSKPSRVNFKIANGQIQSENAVRFDGILCDPRPLVMNSSSMQICDEVEEDSLRFMGEEDDDDVASEERTTFFKKKVSDFSSATRIRNHQLSEKKDILQEAMSAMGSDSLEEQANAENVLTYSNENGSTAQLSQFLGGVTEQSIANFSAKVPPQSLAEPIPILLSKPIPAGPAVSLQAALPVAPGASPVPVSMPVSLQSLIPVKMPPKIDVPGLILRRRKAGQQQDVERKEAPKPDLSIIPILRNAMMPLESAGGASALAGKAQNLNLAAMESFIEEEASVEEKSKESELEEDLVVGSASESPKNEPDAEANDDGDNDDDAQFKSSSEVKELLNWENGTGSLVGSELKFTVNEFDAVELVEDKALDQIKTRITSSCSLPDKIYESSPLNDPPPPLPVPPPSSPPPLPPPPPPPPLPPATVVHVHHARKPNLQTSRKEDESGSDATADVSVGSKSANKNPYDICCCKNCGCYGLSSEFYKAKGNSFCTIACSQDYIVKESEWKKEKHRLEKTTAKTKKKATKAAPTTEKDEQQQQQQQQQQEQEQQLQQQQPKETTTMSEPDPPKEGSSSSQPLKEESSSDAPKFVAPWQDASQSASFSWTKYLEHCGRRSKGASRAAPLKLWLDPFPVGKNLLKAGMKLEGIDPQHQSLFCVMTVADVVGHRIRLHFDGYSDAYDFWCNANSANIFQVGWCERNGRKLETPPGIFNFTWKAYLEHCKAPPPAPRSAFATRGNCAATITPSSNFRIGMKLEAEDRKNGWTCVATTADLLETRILVHFDGWDKAFDAWFETSSPFIHPVGWCARSGVPLYAPKDYANPDSFDWHEYLQETNATAVPARAFRTRPARELKADMKVEAADRRNPMLVRVATVADVKDYKALVHFDGWPDMYDYWADDDSLDIHPPTWCAKTGHPLQLPLTPEQCAEDVDSGVGCGTQGCKGFGHVKGLIYNTHHTAYGCPYSLQNLSKDWDALAPDRLEAPSSKTKKKGAKPFFINLDASKPIPDEDLNSEDSQRKRVRKRRKFFDELSPPEGAKTKISRGLSSDDFGSKGQVLFKPLHSSQAAPTTTFSPSSVHPPGATGDCPPPVSAAPPAPPKAEVSLDTLVHQSIFNPGYHPNPPPPVPHTLERHRHIISGLKLAQRSEIEAWRPLEVRDAVTKIPGCEPASQRFLDQDIDGEALLMLTQNDLVDLLGIKLGPAIKIMAMIINLKHMP